MRSCKVVVVEGLHKHGMSTTGRRDTRIHITYLANIPVYHLPTGKKRMRRDHDTPCMIEESTRESHLLCLGPQSSAVSTSNYSTSY